MESLINDVRPDGVVLELDPERVIRLTKQSAGFDENGDQIDATAGSDVLYGADFVAAVNACRELDIPMFLGDEYAQATRSRLAKGFLDWRAYSPSTLTRSIVDNMSGDGGIGKVRLDMLHTFVKDPQKLLPIAVMSSPPFVLASTLALFNNGSALAYDGSAISSTIETIVSIIVSVLASSLLFNTVIVERDIILAAWLRPLHK